MKFEIKKTKLFIWAHTKRNYLGICCNKIWFENKIPEENYKTLMKDIKDLDKWRDSPSFWIILWLECLCPSKIHTLKSNWQGYSIRKQSPWEVTRSWGPSPGKCPFKRPTGVCLLYSSYEYMEDTIYEKWTLTRHWIYWHLDLRLIVSRTWDIKLPRLWCLVTAAWVNSEN